MIDSRSFDAMTAEEVLRGLPSRLHQVYEPHLETSPDHIAFADTDRTWTYRQFADAVDAVASDFRDLGIRPGDRVMIVSENSTALGACVYAASKIDAWPCVTNPRLSAREIDLIAAHSDARRLIFMTGVSGEAAAHAERRRAEPRTLGPFDGVAVTALNVAAMPEPTHDNRARQVAALIYTSGTTGTPKGVMLSHENLLFTGRTTVMIRDLGPRDGVYGVLPMSHIVGLSSGLVATMMAGATLMPVPRFDPGQLAHALAVGDVTILAGVPATYQRLLAHKTTSGLARLERGRLRIASVAGAPLDLTLKTRVETELGLPLINAFGITECSPGISTVRPGNPRADDTVGQLLPGVEARIVKADGRIAADGEVGELNVRGPNVMLGYYKAPDLTAAAVNADGWFASGDLARFNGPDLYIVGRAKEMIIRSGFNVYPAEIEAVLSGHPAVVQSAVVGRPVEGNEEIIAFVQLLPGTQSTVDDIAAFVLPLLTAYKRPSRIIALDTFPAGSTGKILKHILKEQAKSI